MGSISDGNSGTATTMLTCNAAGTAWVFMGMPVTIAECAYVPRESCTTVCPKTNFGSFAATVGFTNNNFFFP